MLLCTVTAIGPVRLACQPKLMGSAVQTAKDSLLEGADMNSTAIELRDCRAIEQAQQSFVFAAIVRSDCKSASIKSISEYIQPELVMGGLRALTESMEATPHHNMPARLAHVPRVVQ